MSRYPIAALIAAADEINAIKKLGLLKHLTGQSRHQYQHALELLAEAQQLSFKIVTITDNDEIIIDKEAVAKLDEMMDIFERAKNQAIHGTLTNT